ncbi:MAG: GDP-mannose 4,6-dehydratase [Patescibacteria group bacterium]
MKKVLVTGIGGQDGRHLTELLLNKNYEVHGTVRRNESAGQQMWRYNESENGKKLLENIHLHYMDLLDYESVSNVLKEVQPDEIYHMAAVSFVPISWADTSTVLNTNTFGTYRVLEAMRRNCKNARLVNASSSEMYGSAPAPQNETTFFEPRSPYATSKVGAHYLTRNYRDSFDMFTCSSICFNHEGEFRGEDFVTRKISLAAARIKEGKQKELVLGNLDAKRDWGYAKEYTETMWKMLQQDKPDDFVIATGETHSVREFVSQAFWRAGLDYKWQNYVKTDETFQRPAEVQLLLGNNTKAKEKLGWKPKTSFTELVNNMVDEDVKRVKCSLL